MLSNITRSKRVEVVRHSRNFDYTGHTGWGFSFDCDERGNVDIGSLQDPGRANYEACIDHRLDVEDRGVITSRHTYRQPGHGRCACGRVVTLDGDSLGQGIDCDCGRVYNAVGQELAPRSQWEENTRDDY